MERRNWFKRIGIGVAALGGLTVLAGFGFGRHCGGHGDPARMERHLTERIDDVLEDIEATPEQRQQILAVKDRLLAKGKALRGDRAAHLGEMLAAWESPNPDRSQVHARIDTKAAEMQAFAHEVADGLLEVHAILTPAQRAELAAKWKRHAERHQR